MRDTVKAKLAALQLGLHPPQDLTLGPVVDEESMSTYFYLQV